MEIWLKDLSPYDVVQQLASNEESECDIHYIHLDDIKNILEEWGIISYHLKRNSTFVFSEDQMCMQTMALWNSGRDRKSVV